MLAIWNSYRQGLQGFRNYAVAWYTTIVMAVLGLIKSAQRGYVLFPRIKHALNANQNGVWFFFFTVRKREAKKTAQ